MKNPILKSLILVMLFVCLFFFLDLQLVFILVSDFLWTLFNYDIMAIFIVVAAALFLVCFLFYFLKHREKAFIVQTVEFEAPDDMTPMEVGCLIDGIVDSGDVSSLLVYWAYKKYIKIEEQGKEQKIAQLVKVLPDACKSYEKDIFNKIFGVPMAVDVSQIVLSDPQVQEKARAAHKENLAKMPMKSVMAKDISKLLSSSMVVQNAVKHVEGDIKTKYFKTSVIHSRQIMISFFAVLFLFAGFYFRFEYYIDVPVIFGFISIVPFYVLVSVCLLVACADWVLTNDDYRHKNNTASKRHWSHIVFILLIALVSALSFYFFFPDVYISFIMTGLCVGFGFLVFMMKNLEIYKKEGYEKLGKVLGFKDFIATAEADRIKMLAEEDPDLFYHVLPYAFVLGVSDTWIKKLDVIKLEDPVKFEKTLMTLHISSRLVLRSGLMFGNVLRVMSVSKAAGVAISLGMNAKGGSSVGSSRFGGIRRR